MTGGPSLGVVVPALDEEREIAACVDAARRAVGPAAPILVVDGGSRDATRERVPSDASLWTAPRGRAAQLNAGAAALVASCDVLLFCHADCRLPAGAGRAVRDALRDAAAVAGGFHVRWRTTAAGPLRHARARTRTWHRAGWAFGDQALFFRTTAFVAEGGFRSDVDCEDLDLILRIRRRGRLVLRGEEVEVSARRLEAEGRLPTWLRWWSRGLAQGVATTLAPRPGHLEDASGREVRRARSDTPADTEPLPRTGRATPPGLVVP